MSNYSVKEKFRIAMNTVCCAFSSGVVTSVVGVGLLSYHAGPAALGAFIMTPATMLVGGILGGIEGFRVGRDAVHGARMRQQGVASTL